MFRKILWNNQGNGKWTLYTILKFKCEVLLLRQGDVMSGDIIRAWDDSAPDLAEESFRLLRMETVQTVA